MEQILKYFPSLSDSQSEKFSQLKDLYVEWNAKINVISRKDIDHLYLHHVLHSLAIAKLISLKKNTSVLDVGTGGGFPGIPLAILFPEVKFHLVDSVGKKITVVNAIAESLELKNVSAEKCRAEELEGKYDFVVSRAVAPSTEIIHWTEHLISKKNENDLRNGWLLLKGGDLSSELKTIFSAMVFNLDKYFEEEYFREKSLVYISL